MRGVHRAAILLMAAVTAGCTMSHVQVVAARAGEPGTGSEDIPGVQQAEDVGHVYANSWGIYLLAKMPVVAGGIGPEGQPVWAYFQDTVKVQTVVDLIHAEARRRGATHLVNLQSAWISDWSQTSLVFWVVETEASANAIRVTGKPPAGAIPVSATGE